MSSGFDIIGDCLYYNGFVVVDLSALKNFSATEKEEIKDLWIKQFGSYENGYGDGWKAAIDSIL